MIEHRRFGNLLPHLALLAGVVVVAFPVYLAIIASTHDNSVIANGQMPLTPGPHFLENYYRTIFIGTSGTTREPVGTMLFNSFVMAMAPRASTAPGRSASSSIRCCRCRAPTWRRCS